MKSQTQKKTDGADVAVGGKCNVPARACFVETCERLRESADVAPRECGRANAIAGFIFGTLAGGLIGAAAAAVFLATLLADF